MPPSTAELYPAEIRAFQAFDCLRKNAVFCEKNLQICEKIQNRYIPMRSLNVTLRASLPAVAALNQN